MLKISMQFFAHKKVQVLQKTDVILNPRDLVLREQTVSM